jgi:hypothetical protein
MPIFGNVIYAILICAQFMQKIASRPSVDVGHDMGCFRNATDGKVRQVGEVGFADFSDFVFQDGPTRLSPS